MDVYEHINRFFYKNSTSYKRNKSQKSEIYHIELQANEIKIDGESKP